MISKTEKEAAEEVIRQHDNQQKKKWEIQAKEKADRLENTFWKGSTENYADKDGVHIAKAIGRWGTTVRFEEWTYAHDAYYKVNRYELGIDVSKFEEISEKEFYIEVARFIQKIGGKSILKEEFVK